MRFIAIFDQSPSIHLRSQKTLRTNQPLHLHNYYVQPLLSCILSTTTNPCSAPDNGWTLGNFWINFWMSERKRKWSEKMSGAKRKTVSSYCSPAKWGVTIKSVDKWIAENDKQHDTTTWLCYEKADREHVSSLKCPISGEATKPEELQLGVYYRFEESSNVVIQGSRG